MQGRGSILIQNLTKVLTKPKTEVEEKQLKIDDIEKMFAGISDKIAHMQNMQ
jgi:hypothetical protein